jgi:hypothetical protein
LFIFIEIECVGNSVVLLWCFGCWGRRVYTMFKIFATYIC